MLRSGQKNVVNLCGPDVYLEGMEGTGKVWGKSAQPQLNVQGLPKLSNLGYLWEFLPHNCCLLHAVNFLLLSIVCFFSLFFFIVFTVYMFVCLYGSNL